MDLLIDGQALQTSASANRGIGRYVRNLLRALPAVRPGWNIAVVQNARLGAISPGPIAGLPLLSFLPPLPIEDPNADVNELFYGDWLCAHRPRRILIPSGFERGGIMPWFVGSQPALAYVLYDLIPLVFPEQYLAESGAFTSYARHLRRVAAADLLLCDSEATVRDFHRLIPDSQARAINIGGATDPTFATLPNDQLDAVLAPLNRRCELQREFLLSVSGDDFRKNTPGVLHAYAALPDSHRSRYDLVIVCHLRDSTRNQLQDTATQLGIADHVKFAGFVTDEELTALYQRCRLFLFPSLYEGMGLPVLEALRCGAPVAAFNVSSIPEYAGRLSWLAEPPSPHSLARAVEQALTEPRDARLKERLAFAQRFDWNRTASLACQALDFVCPHLRYSAGEGQGVRGRRRIAFVSPLPPSHTGIADYSAELLAPLADRFDIELVIDPQQPAVSPDLKSRHRILNADELAGRHAAVPFDLFVYQLGNSSFHDYMLGLMSRFRGLVVLHDYYLAGLLAAGRQNNRWPFSQVDELEYEGETQMADWLRQGIFPTWAADCLQSLNQRVLELATGIVVHSGWSWQRLRRFVDVPVYQVPQIMSVPRLGSRVEERRRLGLPVDAFLICTLGQLVHQKRIEILIQALARLPDAMRGQTRLLLVGAGSPELRVLHERLAESLGVSSMIDYVGRVPLSDLSAYARAADVCVQLRYPTHGETSASLLRALAAGTACITSDQGPMAEVPATVAWKVRSPYREVEDLAANLHSLFEKPHIRQRLGKAALGYIEEQHGPSQVAAKFTAVIEQTIAQRQASDQNWQDHAANALANCSDAKLSGTLMEPWLRMRRQGQRPAAGRTVQGAHLEHNQVAA